MCNIVKRQGQTRLTTYGIENVGKKYEVKQLVFSVTFLATYLYSCSPHCFIGVVEKAWKNVKYGIFRENQFLLKQRKIIQSFAEVHKFPSGSHTCKIGTTTKKGIPKPSQPIRTTRVSWIQSRVDVKPVEKPVKLAMTIIKYNRKCDILPNLSVLTYYPRTR